MRYYYPDDSLSLLSRVVTVILFAILFAPFCIGMYRLLGPFQFSVDTFVGWIEHPILRGLFALCGGVFAWRLLNPLRRRQPVSYSTVPGGIHAKQVYLFVHRDDEDDAPERLFSDDDEDPNLSISELTPERLDHILNGHGDQADEDNDDEEHEASPSADDDDFDVDDDTSASPSSAPAAAPQSNGTLTLELVPKSCWYSNLRSVLSGDQWSSIRKSVYRAAHNRCEICGGRGPKWPVEAHESWSYDNTRKVQRLESIRALCPDCHEVKHFGLARIRGRAVQALKHLMKVNRWGQSEANAHIYSSFNEWEERSRLSWSIDLSHLTEFGFAPEEIDALEKLERPIGNIH
jgi:hypothetical protein